MPTDLALPTNGSVWIHQAGATIDLSLGRAVEIALARTSSAGDLHRWQQGSIEDRTADLRALFVGALWLQASFSKLPPFSGLMKVPGVLTKGLPTLQIPPPGAPEDYSSTARYELARLAFVRTWELLLERAERMALSSEKMNRVLTVGGARALAIPEGTLVPPAAGDAGAFPILEVVAMIVGAVTICFMAERTAQIVDRVLARQADSAALMQTQAKTMELLNGHRENEKIAGKELPLSPAELEVLKRLQSLQDDYGKRNSAGGPFPELFPSGGQVTGLGMGVILAVAVVAALVLMKGR